MYDFSLLPFILLNRMWRQKHFAVGVCSTCCFRSNSFALCERCVGFGAVLAFIMVEKSVCVQRVAARHGMGYVQRLVSLLRVRRYVCVFLSMSPVSPVYSHTFSFIRGFVLAHLLCVLLFSHLHFMFFGGCCLFCLHRFWSCAIMWCAKYSDVHIFFFSKT